MNNIKTFHRLLTLVAISALALSFTAGTAYAADTSKAPGDIITTAQQAGKFTTFLRLVSSAGLAKTLKKGDYTVFAPTDDAFAKLAPGTVDDLLKPENKAKLTLLLQYHIVPRILPSSMFAKTSSTTHNVDTLANKQLTFRSDNNGVTVNEAKVEETDIQATNGVIHAIDTVLTLPAS